MSDMMYGQIMAHSAVAADVGATVTFTDDGGSSQTGTIGADGYCRKKLPAFKRFTVTLGSFTSDPIELGCGENKFVECGLTTANWAGIKRIIDAHKAADYIQNGDQFEVQLTTNEKLVFLANVNTYGLDEVDFIPTYCLSTGRGMNSSNTNVGGWDASAMRQYLNETFLVTLPADLQAVISTKTLKRSAGNQSTALVTATDKIWLPTEKEIFGAITYAASTEAAVQSQYPIFTDANSRVRKLGANGAATTWWESSPCVSYAAHFCFVTAGGTADYSYASNAYGVLPCFRIAPAS